MLFGFDTKKKKILTMLTLIMLVGTSFLTGAVLAAPPSTWSDQPTYIGPGSMVNGASYVIFKDTAGAYCAKNGVTGQINYRDSNITIVLQSVVNILTTGGLVQFTSGNFSTTPSHVDVTNPKITFQGVGDSTILYNIGFNVTASGISFKDFFAGGVNDVDEDHRQMALFEQSNGGDDFHYYNIHTKLGIRNWSFAAFSVIPYNTVIQNGIYDHCSGVDGAGFTFLNWGFGSPKIVLNIQYLNCVSINAGRDRSSGFTFNDWVCGFDVAENCDAQKITLINCVSSGSWESGFHTETSVPGLVMIGCVANDNGQKTGGAIYGMGFNVNEASDGMMSNCRSWDNKVGFGIGNTKNTFLGDTFTMTDCSDWNSGKSLYIVDIAPHVGRFVVNNFYSEGATLLAFDIQGVNNSYLELTARNALCTESKVVYLGFWQYPVTNSTIVLDIESNAGKEYVVFGQGMNNCLITGRIRGDATNAIMSFPGNTKVNRNVTIEDMVLETYNTVGYGIYFHGDNIDCFVRDIVIRVYAGNIAFGVSSQNATTWNFLVDRESIVGYGTISYLTKECNYVPTY